MSKMDGTSTDNSKNSLLCIILDTNPVWWGKRLISHDEMTLSHCVDCLTVMANSHLMLAHKNKLAIIAAHTDHSTFLYPPSRSASQTCGFRLPDDGQYETFNNVEALLKSQLKQLVAEDKQQATDYMDYMEERPSDSLLAGAMCMALAYIHRLDRESSMGESLQARILIVKGSEDCPAQYMNFMNAVFTAQKQNVVIDACILDAESGLLQQACDITGGTYLKIPQAQGLLEYLLWVFLPDPASRAKMALPPRAQVDYRAACFCHRNLIEIGYVCSLCLSIYCSFSPICSTCQTTFKITGPQKLVKKKIKKL